MRLDEMEEKWTGKFGVTLCCDFEALGRPVVSGGSLVQRSEEGERKNCKVAVLILVMAAAAQWTSTLPFLRCIAPQNVVVAVAVGQLN